MVMNTTYPAVQFYTANMLTNAEGRNGSMYGPYSGVCFETEYYPDSPNISTFPSAYFSPSRKYMEQGDGAKGDWKKLAAALFLSALLIASMALIGIRIFISTGIRAKSYDEIIAERLDRGLLDFGLFVGLTDLSKYDYLRLPMVNRFGLLMRQDDPLSAHQTIEAQLLQELPLICPRQVLQQNDLSWWLGHGLERFKVVATYSLLFNAAILVEEGLGYALCIDGLIENERLCFKPLEQNNTAQLVFAWRRTSMLSQASKCFLEILKPLLKTSSASSVSSAGSSAQP